MFIDRKRTNSPSQTTSECHKKEEPSSQQEMTQYAGSTLHYYMYSTLTLSISFCSQTNAELQTCFK